MGNLKLLNAKHTVGIVGARECTDYGKKVTKEFSKAISKQEICVISGLALGIDGIAHQSALNELGKTIAVLGGGFYNIYPKEHEWLFKEIIEKDGCVISEFLPNEKANKSNFPIRNRLISGLSDALLVVEASYRSGSSITAKYAKAQGKILYAIPNTIYESKGIGTNTLIKEGAILVTKPEEIINKIKNLEETEKSSNFTRKIKQDNKNIVNNNNYRKSIKIKKEYLSIYKIISNIPKNINDIANELGKSIMEINSIITMMEIEGYIKQKDPNYYVRNEDEIK